ncbi:flagellar motor stator protein MotA [Candidatus Odyssella acanthamoebae]|uniref:Flagellar motor protein MotA n=1 Tax=Candidatus Odyssella acanthamoebae TaxID=91604 RepID=A0A077ARK6_9PROT|nr:flagellar motor stator protein MotA [Candidatus Paracaedibacter acanthamoebae]AIK95837.1 flagellar motor protein MotA [Candidatus Paracaedibacter acanthamoebae]
MLFIVGMVVVFSCVLGAYAAHGGHLGVLWQPLEFVIIFGAATGAFIISCPKHVLGRVGAAYSLAFKGNRYTKADYLELLTMQFTVFKLIKTKGMLELEAHLDNPHESSLFSRFPAFVNDHHACEFFCDYLRMMTMGAENVHQLEDLMNEQLEVHHAENHAVTHALTLYGDSFPAIGIVAAVLGVIHTMGSINQPPEVLGHLIGAALVGTFAGILISYGFMAPLANCVTVLYDNESKYFQCMKAGIIACMNGYAPAIAVEFSRKSIESDFRPSFAELEEAIQNAPAG